MKNEFCVTIVGVEKGDTIDRRASGTRIKTIKSRFIPERRLSDQQQDLFVTWHLRSYN